MRVLTGKFENLEAQVPGLKYLNTSQQGNIQNVNVMHFEVDYYEDSSEEEILFHEIAETYRKEFLNNLGAAHQELYTFMVSPEWENENAILKYKKIKTFIPSNSFFSKKEADVSEIVVRNNYARCYAIWNIRNDELTKVIPESYLLKYMIFFSFPNLGTDLKELGKQLFDTSITPPENKTSNEPNWLRTVDLIQKKNGFIMLPGGHFDYGAITMDIFF